MFENWLYKLVSALHTREKEANIVVVDWLPLAHQIYMDAVNNTQAVGRSIARMLDWLQVTEHKRESSSFASRIPNPNPLKKYRSDCVTMNFRCPIKIFGIQVFYWIKYCLKYLKTGTFRELFN